jgi:hypothetical protein
MLQSADGVAWLTWGDANPNLHVHIEVPQRKPSESRPASNSPNNRQCIQPIRPNQPIN